MRRVVGLLVAVLLGAAAVGVGLAGPAAAAACAKGTGVTVVVGSDVRCYPAGAGKSAVTDFTAVGHTLESYQGFVCRIDNVPSKKDEPCTRYPPADAYWGLFWSNGTGTWTYSQSGASGLTVPAGGWVGFMFQKGSGKTPPPVKPMAAAPVKPKPHKSTTPTGGGSTTGAPPSATPTATASTSKPSQLDKKSASTTAPTASTTAATPPSDDLKSTSQGTGGSSSLGWVAAALAVVLIAGMGAVVWRRRTAGGRTS